MSGGGSSSDEARERRLALNEALARDVNEFVEELASGWYDPADEVDFRCECVLRECEETVRLTRAEYARVRSSPATFVVVPGHEAPEIEREVDRIREYVLIEKLGTGKAVAETTAPPRDAGDAPPPGAA